MVRLKKIIPILLLSSLSYIFLIGCGPAVIVRQPPPVRTEVRPAQPFKGAIWISGHWKWSPSAREYVWVPGHWAKQKPEKTWVPGHWTRKGRGWVWVKGHWR